jgi:hypothetical protein
MIIGHSAGQQDHEDRASASDTSVLVLHFLRRFGHPYVDL